MRVAKPYPEYLSPSLRGALLSAEARLRAKADATKQSIARRPHLWIASLTGRRLAPSRWLAMTVDDIPDASCLPVPPGVLYPIITLYVMRNYC